MGTDSHPTAFNQGSVKHTEDVESGSKVTITCMYAFDVGWSVAIAKIVAKGGLGFVRTTELPEQENQRGLIKFDTPPLVRRIDCQLPKVGDLKPESSAMVSVFDSGAISVRFQILASSAELSSLVDLSSQLQSSDSLLKEARRLATETLELIRPFTERPNLHPEHEDYFVFDIEKLGHSEGNKLLELAKEHQLQIAQILLGETRALSPERVTKSLEMQTSFHDDDLIVFGWRGAISIGKDWDDVVAIMEHANVELLELRRVKTTVEQELKNLRLSLKERQFWQLRRWFHWHSLVQIQELVAEIREQIRRIDNPLNLTGDTFLAESYSMIMDRMGISDEEQNVKDLLEELSDLEGSIAERAATMRTDLIAVATFALGLAIGESEFFGNAWAWLSQFSRR